jgi:hypothetical protein
MREESEELLEHLALRRKRMPNLSKLLSQIDTAPQYKKVAKKLIEIGKKALNYVQKDNPFNIENLIQFAIWKSSARTEFYYKNPKLEYDVAKHVAKSWEKLLEAVTFLLPLTR